MNRITSATGGTANTNYDVSNISYDKNGNIQSLSRNGYQESSVFTDMDVLDYDYDNGNKLLKVADTGNKAHGFKDGTNTNDDFEYDINGNLKIDRNKGITSITYNHLNLPEQVNFGSDNIKYVYDATGAKLKRTSSSGTETLYAGNFIYEGGIGISELQFFGHPEGYVTPDSQGGYDYVYNYVDHLGSVRLSYTDADDNGSIDPANEIIEDNAYYPFGLLMRSATSNISPHGNSAAKRWKFNGMELDGSFNIDTYDFGARNYDPTIGRWMNLDPLADTYTSFSPYVFVVNNPVFFVDPDGKRIDISGVYKQDKDGNDVLDKNGNRILTGVNITITGKLTNQSGTAFTDKQLSSFATRLGKSIEDSFSSASEKGFEVNVSTDITVASDTNPLTETDHAFNIVDEGKVPTTSGNGKFFGTGTVGAADFGELGVSISTAILESSDTPATKGKYAGTGLTSSGYGTIERTGAHELGHSARLEHPSKGTMADNLMNQSRRSDAGMKLTKAQILEMKESFDKKLLNKGRQFYNSPGKSIGPRKKDGTF